VISHAGAKNAQDCGQDSLAEISVPLLRFEALQGILEQGYKKRERPQMHKNVFL
jgi:hypothetical protein